MIEKSNTVQRTRQVLLVAVVAALAGTQFSAASGAPPAPSSNDPAVSPAILAIDGDPDYGAYLSGECVTCHRLTGEDTGIPSIIGWPREDFVTALHAYKNQDRPHPGMRMIAGRLSDEEIAALAAYFESAGN